MPPEPVEDDGLLDEHRDECCLLSEESLAAAWNRPEEDAAWAYLQLDIGDHDAKISP